MKKFLSVFLSLVLLINILPLGAAMADTQYVEVTADSAPIRNDYYETGDALQWVSRGTMLKVIKTKTNMYFNKWYQVEYETGYSCVRGWIYSGNIKEHSHNYQTYEYNGNKFGVCTKCGTISVERVRTVETTRADALAAALPAAGVAAGADGPIPVGDIVGLFILGLACLEIGRTPTTTMIREWIDSISIPDYIRENNACTVESFYLVSLGDNLQKLDNNCMNPFQAFVASRYYGFNVWTMDPDAALLCVSFNGSRFFGPEKDSKNPDRKYNHYHYGRDHKDKDAETHVFFGTNNWGETPSSP